MNLRGKKSVTSLFFDKLMRNCLTLNLTSNFLPKQLIIMILHKVFAYGSLLKRQTQKELFGQSLPVFSKAVLKDWVLIKSKNFPYILPSEGKLVEGSVLQLTPQQLEKADQWEEIPTVYQREKLTVRTADGSYFNVWAYTRRHPL